MLNADMRQAATQAPAKLSPAQCIRNSTTDAVALSLEVHIKARKLYGMLLGTTQPYSEKQESKEISDALLPAAAHGMNAIIYELREADSTLQNILNELE